MERGEPFVTVIGGINMDIGGSPAGALRERDSNPGTVSLRPGGVGRNIAHNLRLLGLNTRLICALGDDVFGKALLQSCESLGIHMGLSLLRPRERSSTYLYINDETGDMRLAVADMDIADRISPQVLEERLERINQSAAVVLDANLSEASIRYLAEHVTAPLIADPVSAAKASRLLPALGRLWALKPNVLEAGILTGEEEPEAAARALLRAGVERVYLSLGGEGMLCAQGDRLLRLPCSPCRVVNTTGAGDAATAALCLGLLRGLDLEETGRLAVRAGALTCESGDANSPRLGELAEM